jgi:hypothetical protein
VGVLVLVIVPVILDVNLNGNDTVGVIVPHGRAGRSESLVGRTAHP